MSKTKVITLQDIKTEKNIEDDTEKLLLECLTEIENLNKSLYEEKIKNNKNENYIELLEKEIKDLYIKYKNTKEALDKLDEFKKINRMNNEKIKSSLKEKLNSIKSSKYENLSIEELNEISANRLKKLKEIHNIL